MDKWKALLNRPVVVAGLAFVAGLFIGLVVLGWWLWPVKWTDAAPAHLRTEYQVDYLRMVMDSYRQNQDADLARQRYQALGDKGPQVLDLLRKNAGEQNLDQIESFAAVVSSAPEEQPAGAQTTPMPTPASAKEGGRLGILGIFLILVGLLVVLGVAGAVVFFLRKRIKGPRKPSTPMEWEKQIASGLETTDFTAEGREPPLAQFNSTYVQGDDLFDESFSVDSPTGEFLGECGVGIADTIGVGEPKKVSAFEVWLFDKNDIQTVTQVLMSEHAFNDEATRQRLATKGELVLAEPGQTLVLETATLQLVARVVDMVYGEGALPEHSYFERLSLDLAVWRKETEGEEGES